MSLKLKRELFEKIAKYSEILEEMSEIECQNNGGVDNPEWFMTHDEYQYLSVQLMDLQGEVDVLLLDFKNNPLDRLNQDEIKRLDFFLKSSDLNLEQNFVKHLDFRLLGLKEAIKERYKNIKHLLLTENLTSSTRNFYREIVGCYIYGFFKASCVLCRATAESIAKKQIEDCGFGHLLVGKEGGKRRIILDILENELSIPKGVTKLYSQIGNKADNILHKKDHEVTEKDPLQSIELLQSFIKRFPKSL